MRTIPVWKTPVAALALTAANAHSQTPTPVKPMAADALRSFANATIKPMIPPPAFKASTPVGDRYSIHGQTIVSRMMFAYAIDKHQVVETPPLAASTPRAPSTRPANHRSGIVFQIVLYKYPIELVLPFCSDDSR